MHRLRQKKLLQERECAICEREEDAFRVNTVKSEIIAMRHQTDYAYRAPRETHDYSIREAISMVVRKAIQVVIVRRVHLHRHIYTCMQTGPRIDR